jgi:hypothetical protein
MTIIFLRGSFAHVWTHIVSTLPVIFSLISLFLFLAMWTKRVESEDCTRWLLPSGRPRSFDRGHYPASSSQVCLPCVNHSIFHIIIVSKSLYSPKQTVTCSNSFVHAPMAHMKVGQISSYSYFSNLSCFPFQIFEGKQVFAMMRTRFIFYFSQLLEIKSRTRQPSTPVEQRN